MREPPAPRLPARPPSRRAFWLFVAIIALAIAGGGAVAMLGRRSVAARRGHPDTIAPASRAAPSASAEPPPSPSPPPRADRAP